MGAFLRLTKKLICPQCGDVLADADYRPLVGSLTLVYGGKHELRTLAEEGTYKVNLQIDLS